MIRHGFLGTPPGEGGDYYDNHDGYDNYDNQMVGQMTIPQDLPRMGDLARPTESRVQLLQELKAVRREKVRLHRLQGNVRVQTRRGSSPAPAQHRHGTGSTLHRGSSLDTTGVRDNRMVVIKGRGVSCPRLAGAGIEVERKAAVLPWTGRRPPIDKGGQIAPGRHLPPSTIQTDLIRAPAVIGLARVLLPSEDPLRQPAKDNLLQVENRKSHHSRAFIRLASKRCRAIILALPDSGNLCKADIMSLSTFKTLNKCTIRKLQLDPVEASSDIRSVTGSTLKIDGKIRGGILVQLQGSAGTLHLNPLISSNFTGSHLNLSQQTMSRLKIQLRPNLQDGGHFVTQMGTAPLLPPAAEYTVSIMKNLFLGASPFSVTRTDGYTEG